MSTNVENEEDLFRQTVENRKKQKAEEEANKDKKGNFTRDYEEITWAGLSTGQWGVFRILGLPIDLRKEHWHPKLILWSQVVTDKGDGYAKINWKQKMVNGRETGELDEDWILYRLYKAINAHKWEKYPNGEKDKDGNTGYRKFYHEDTPMFQRVANNRKEGDKYKKKFYPSKKVVMNIIDRMDEWCKANHHTKLLSSKHKFWKNNDAGEPIFFTDPGVPLKGCYNKIIDNVVHHNGSWQKLDVVVKRKGEDDDYDYEVRDASETKIDDEKVKSIATMNPLTDEELAYEKYNLDKLFPVTSFSKIKRVLGNLFKEWDAYAASKGQRDCNFYDELLAACKIEEEEMAKRQAEREAAEAANPKPAQVAAPAPQAQPAPVQVAPAATPAPAPTPATPAPAEEPTRRRSAPAEEAPASVADQCAKNLPSWTKLTPKDQENMIKSVEKFENGIPVFLKTARVYPCDNQTCKFPGTDRATETPDTVLTCPVCGMKFST